jgi:Cu-Zn family superoxide dismutase
MIALAGMAIAYGVAVNTFAADLRDYDTTASSPFDHATAKFQLVTSESRTTAILLVRGVATSASGQSFGAHLHNAACATNQPTLSGGHYNHDAHSGTTPVRVSDHTEVWLDFTVNPNGSAQSVTVVPFGVISGARSIVIHANPTDPATGGAGTRLACLPVQW